MINRHVVFACAAIFYQLISHLTGTEATMLDGMIFGAIIAWLAEPL